MSSSLSPVAYVMQTLQPSVWVFSQTFAWCRAHDTDYHHIVFQGDNAPLLVRFTNWEATERFTEDTGIEGTVCEVRAEDPYAEVIVQLQPEEDDWECPGEHDPDLVPGSAAWSRALDECIEELDRLATGLDARVRASCQLGDRLGYRTHWAVPGVETEQHFCDRHPWQRAEWVLLPRDGEAAVVVPLHGQTWFDLWAATERAAAIANAAAGESRFRFVLGFVSKGGCIEVAME